MPTPPPHRFHIQALTAALVTLAALSYIAIWANGDPPPVALVLTAPAVTVLIVDAWQSRKRRRTAVEQAERSPAERLRELNAQVAASMQNTASLLERLSRELEDQKAAAEATIAEGEERARWLEINREEAEKVRQLIVGETKETLRAQRRRDWMLLGAGALLSIPIGVLINLLVPGN